jgi:hypothetical protein
MAGAGHRKAGRSTDLFAAGHQDGPRSPPGIPSTAASDGGLLRSVAVELTPDEVGNVGATDGGPFLRYFGNPVGLFRFLSSRGGAE